MPKIATQFSIFSTVKLYSLYLVKELPGTWVKPQLATVAPTHIMAIGHTTASL
jgi:hypothetical protein